VGPAEAFPLQLRLVRRDHLPALHRGNPQRKLVDGQAIRSLGFELADATLCVTDAKRQGNLHHHRQVPDGRSQGVFKKTLK